MLNFTIRLVSIICFLLVFTVSALCQQLVDIKEIDVSKSMVKNNMFESAKAALINNIKLIPDGTEVVVIMFGLTADKVIDRKIVTNEDRDDIIEAVQWLSPTEDYTQFDEMVKETKLVCYELRTRYNNQVKIRITVLSDGISSPDKSLGKQDYNLESVVSQTFPQSNGFNIYLISLKEAETKEPANLNFEKTTNQSVVSVVTPAEDIGKALTGIDSIEWKKNRNTISESDSAVQQPGSDGSNILIPVIIILVVIIASIVIYLHNQSKKEIDDLTEDLNKSDQIAQGKAKPLVTKLKIQESTIGNDGKLVDTQGAHFLKFYPNYSFSIGKNLQNCSVILKSEKSPLVLCTVTIDEKGNQIQISNESGNALVINKQPVKDGHSQNFSIDQKIIIIALEQIMINLEKILVKDENESEINFLANLSSETPVNEEELIEQPF